MAYQVLARKWRPQDFSQVVGQKPIVTALGNALTEGRIAQAYLFSGIRGVGKTSVARILAKALNCEQGPTAAPCNECVSCREITASSGTNLDVHEIDAATHSKVEQVRDLTEGLKYGPARDRYKVVIIDEIHRLSRQAFDALLKIVEEPPAHLVFIFATTESEAVPVTILSRCQEFRFRRVPSQDLVAHLRKISDAEKIEVSDAALRLLARAGDGSVRDAVALLDQLATFGSGKIPDEDAARLLGGVDHDVFHRLLVAIVGGDSRSVSTVVHEIGDQGWDPRHVYSEFLTYCRDALHLALGGATSDVELPEEEAARLAALAKRSGYENLLRLLHQMLASENTVRRSEMGSLALEICWLRAAELPKLIRVEEILGGRTPEDAGGSEPAQEPEPAPPTSSPPTEGRLFRGRPEPTPDIEPGPSVAAPPTPVPEEPPLPQHPDDRDVEASSAPPEEPASEPVLSPEPAAPIESSVPEDPPAEQPASAPSFASALEDGTSGQNGLVDRFLNEVSRRKLPLAAHLREARDIVFEGRMLRIFCLPDDPWLNTRALNRKSNREALAAALEAVVGADAKWRVVECDEEHAPPPREEPKVEEANQDPRIQKVLDIFGGHVEVVDDPSVDAAERKP